MYWSLHAAYRKETSLWQIAIIVSTIITVAFVIRIWALGDYSLFDDEILTEFRAQAPFSDSVESIMKTGDQAPFYFFVLRAFPTDTEFSLRLPSVLFGILGILVMMRITQVLYGRLHLSLLVGAWLAINPFHVFVSRTARHYSLIFLLAALIIYQFLRLYQRTTRQSHHWLIFTGLCAIAYITHYSMLALPFAQFIYLLYRRDFRTRFTWNWLKSQTVASVPALIWLGMVVSVYESRTIQWSRTPQIEDLDLTFWNFIAGYDGVVNWYVLPVVLGCAVLGLYAMLSSGKTASTTYWFILITVPVIIVYLVSITVVDLYQDRYFTALFPGLILLIVDGLQHFSRNKQIAVLTILIITGLTSVGTMFKNHQYVREDWQSVSQYLDDHYEQADVVVVDRAVTLKAISRYRANTANLQLIQLDETHDAIPPLEEGRTYWLIYPNPDPDIHTLGGMPDFDIYEAFPTTVAQWLSDYRDLIVDYVMFKGVAIVKLVK